MSDRKQPMSWGMIIAVMVVVGFAAGLTLGLLGTVVPLPTSMTTGGVGAVIGVVGALLISNRRKRLAAERDEG